jgi:hypothetical protein
MDFGVKNFCELSNLLIDVVMYFGLKKVNLEFWNEKIDCDKHAITDYNR